MAEKKNHTPVIVNRKAEHEFFLLDRFQAGIVLTGTEVKSIRRGKAQLTDAYCFFQGGELWVRNLHISPYDQGSVYNHEPRRNRKLLLTARELRKLRNRMEEKGMTIVPTKIYFNERNFCKLEIALSRGRKSYDKRDRIKERDVKRDLERRSDD